MPSPLRRQTCRFPVRVRLRVPQPQSPAHRTPSPASARAERTTLLRGDGRTLEDTRLVNEAERIAKRIVQVKRPLAPGTARDLPHRQTAVAGLRRQSAGVLRTPIHGLEIGDGEVDVI